MKRKIVKGVLSAVFVLSLAAPVLFVGEARAALDLWGGGSKREEVRNALGYESSSEQDPRTLAATIISIILGFLGIIAVILIIYGGFLWMTAGGNEDQVKKAISFVKNGVIGLLIILAAWSIASFAISSLSEAVGG